MNSHSVIWMMGGLAIVFLFLTQIVVALAIIASVVIFPGVLFFALKRGGKDRVAAIGILLSFILIGGIAFATRAERAEAQANSPEQMVQTIKEWNKTHWPKEPSEPTAAERYHQMELHTFGSEAAIEKFHQYRDSHDQNANYYVQSGRRSIGFNDHKHFGDPR